MTANEVQKLCIRWKEAKRKYGKNNPVTLELARQHFDAKAELAKQQKWYEK